LFDRLFREDGRVLRSRGPNAYYATDADLLPTPRGECCYNTPTNILLTHIYTPPPGGLYDTKYLARALPGGLPGSSSSGVLPDSGLGPLFRALGPSSISQQVRVVVVGDPVYLRGGGCGR
jgi:hypothetical protein